jgi:hypothetical protein
VTARVKKVIKELAELSAPEIEELFTRVPALRRAARESTRRVCRNEDLKRFLEGHAPDPDFADDIEAGVRERRARAEDRTSRWDLVLD